MSSPPLTAAELNKFAEACRTQNMAIFTKYYEKMRRSSVDFNNPVYVRAAEDGLRSAIAYDNAEMFDALLSMCRHADGSFMWRQIVDYSVPTHTWALDKALACPHIPALTYQVDGNTLSRWVANNNPLTDSFKHLIDATQPTQRLAGAQYAAQSRQWDSLMFIMNYIHEPYFRWRVALDAANADAPDEIMTQLLEGTTEENAMRLLDERKDKFSPQRYAEVWNKFSTVFTTQQAQRIAAEITNEHPIASSIAQKRKL